MRGRRAARNSPPGSAQKKKPQQHQQFELSTSVLSSRAKRPRVREQRSRCRQTEMTEEEMMDVALQLSEEEPRVSTLMMQQEEEQEEDVRRSLDHSSCTSNQMEDADGRRSPVFPSSSCRAEVRLGRLDSDLLQTCTTLGFVRCSQDTLTPVQSPLSLGLSGVSGRSPVFSRTAQQDETSQDSFNGPTFPGSPAPTPCPHRGRPKLVDGPPVRNIASESNLVQGLDVNNRLYNSLNGELDNRLGGGPGRRYGPSSYPRTMETWILAGTPLTCDTTLVVMNEDVTPPSPVFPQEHPPSTRFRVEGDLQNIHYYWGVPFCPGGLDPDVYTQVILAQFEVQKKCLKQAQRRLLNKAPWGGAILPQLELAESPHLPASRGQCVSRRLRVTRRQQSAVEEEDGDGKQEEEEEDRDGKHEEEEEDVGETRVESDCEFCPETQLSDSVQELSVFTKDRDEPPATNSELQILRDYSAAGEEEEQQQEEEQGEQQEEQKEEEEQQQAQTEADEELRGVPDVEEVRRPPTVDCPLCQRPFPTYRIQLHAAYCEGEMGPDPRRHVTLKRRRVKRTVELSAEEISDIDRVQQEKCYICHRDVSLSEYSQHTERCIQRHTSKTAMRGGLLSALQQNESRDSDAGPSHPKLQPGDVIDLRDDDKEEEEEAFRISRAPIRTFTPISEATDCLVDFRRQRVKKPCHRRR